MLKLYMCVFNCARVGEGVCVCVRVREAQGGVFVYVQGTGACMSSLLRMYVSMYVCTPIMHVANVHMHIKCSLLRGYQP